MILSRLANPVTGATLGPPSAPWRSGYAAACKAVYSGSNPDGALLDPGRPCLGVNGRRCSLVASGSAPPTRRSVDAPFPGRRVRGLCITPLSARLPADDCG